MTNMGIHVASLKGSAVHGKGYYVLSNQERHKRLKGV